jgi:HEPN domain-containing protein/predicted nucleotidyltransferase
MSPFDASDATLCEITSAIVEQCDPHRVILFGSRARGDHRADSDYDILVVLDSGGDRLRESLRERYHVDVLTDTPVEFGRRRNDVGTMEYVVEREGRVLYDRAIGGEASSCLRESLHEPPDSFHEWMDRARGDFRVMQLAAGEVPEAVYFHAQQSAEKFLKAALVFRQTPPPRTHRLVELIRVCAPELRGDPGLRNACEVLDAVYESSRYPNRPLPTAAEVSTSVIAAQTVRAAVEAFMANGEIGR